MVVKVRHGFFIRAAADSTLIVRQPYIAHLVQFLFSNCFVSPSAVIFAYGNIASLCVLNPDRLTCFCFPVTGSIPI